MTASQRRVSCTAYSESYGRLLGGRSCFRGFLRVYMCYVDESGDAETVRSANRESPPVFVLVGMIAPVKSAKALTWDFLALKKEFNPTLSDVQLSEVINAELKGSKLRKDVRSEKKSRNVRRRAMRIIDQTVTLLETHDCRLVGKIVVKPVDEPRRDVPIYSTAIAEMAKSFEAKLAEDGRRGLMVLDARTKVKNAPSVQGITTRRFKSGGDAFPHLIESPVFGHSDTHVPLQVVDIVASAVLFPIACHAYCSDLTWNAHPHPRYKEIKARFGDRIQRLEYRYEDVDGLRRGGFQVIDPFHRRPTHLMFRD